MRFTKTELTRLRDLLKETDPRTDEYTTLLRNLEMLAGMDLDSYFDAPDNPCAPAPVEFPETNNVTPFPVPDHSEPEPPVKVEPTPEPEPAPAEPEATYSASDVRKALVGARKNKGVDVSDLIHKMGYDNFSAVPAGKYGALMKLLEEA